MSTRDSRNYFPSGALLHHARGHDRIPLERAKPVQTRTEDLFLTIEPPVVGDRQEWPRTRNRDPCPRFRPPRTTRHGTRLRPRSGPRHWRLVPTTRGLARSPEPPPGPARTSPVGGWRAPVRRAHQPGRGLAIGLRRKESRGQCALRILLLVPSDSDRPRPWRYSFAPKGVVRVPARP